MDRNTAQQGQDTDIPNDYHHEDMDNFKNAEQENHTSLATLTQDLDDSYYRIQAGEGQSTVALNHIECKLHRLTIALLPSAQPQPLDDVLQQYTETLCSAQKQTTFLNTLIQDIPTFNVIDSTQLEDWLVDIETTANLTDESRTKLSQDKSKGLTHTLITEALALSQRLLP